MTPAWLRGSRGDDSNAQRAESEADRRHAYEDEHGFGSSDEMDDNQEETDDEPKIV